MKILSFTFFASLLLAISLVACKSKSQLNSGVPDWLLTYDEVGKLHHQFINEFQSDSTRLNGTERLLYHEIQKRWTELLTARSDMMMEPESEDMPVGGNVNMSSEKIKQKPKIKSVSGKSQGEPPMMKFTKKVRGSLAAYEHLAYVMKGIPGRAKIDTILQRSIRKHQLLLQETRTDTLSPVELSELISPGEIITLYKENCADCHGIHGEGASDAYPPLDRSSLAAKNKVTLIKVVLQGLDGTVVVGGRRYDGAMPSFRASLSDPQIAALLRYVRSMVGVSDVVIKTNEVKQIAEETASRSEPFTPADLNLNR